MMRVHRLQRDQHVAPPPYEAFEFFADATRLEEITPPWLGFHILAPAPTEMRAGTQIDYRLRLHGVPIRWRTRVEAWEPGRRFVDRQVSGPYRVWHHTHEFRPDDHGGTVISDVVRYALPLRPLGEVAHLLFVRRDLERIFDFRRGAVERLLGTTT